MATEPTDAEFEALEVECALCGVAYTGYGHECGTANDEPLRKLLADWFEAALFRISETGTSADWQVLIEDAKARHETFGIEWNNTFVPDYVREILAIDD